RIALQPRHLGVEPRIGVRADFVAVEVEVDTVADVDHEVLLGAWDGRAQGAAVDGAGRGGRIPGARRGRRIAGRALRGRPRGAGGDGDDRRAGDGDADEGRGLDHQSSPGWEASASSFAIKLGYLRASSFASRDNAKLSRKAPLRQ